MKEDETKTNNDESVLLYESLYENKGERQKDNGLESLDTQFDKLIYHISNIANCLNNGEVDLAEKLFKGLLKEFMGKEGIYKEYQGDNSDKLLSEISLLIKKFKQTKDEESIYPIVINNWSDLITFLKMPAMKLISSTLIEAEKPNKKPIK